jgi:hypothetical protein
MLPKAASSASFSKGQEAELGGMVASTLVLLYGVLSWFNS